MIDTVDDLHCAEDRIGLLEHTLEGLMRALEEGSPADYSLSTANARSVLAAGYCRPSCYHEEGEPEEGWCGFCAARIHRTSAMVDGDWVETGWAHDPPYGEHDEPIVVEYDDDPCGCPCHSGRGS